MVASSRLRQAAPRRNFESAPRYGKSTDFNVKAGHIEPDDDVDTRRFNEPRNVPEGLKVSGVDEALIKPNCSGPMVIVGSWSNFRDHEAMEWNDDGVYRACIQLREGDREGSFQILHEGKWEEKIYPTEQNANLSIPHGVQGPGSEGGHLMWTIGRDKGDASELGASYEVSFVCPQGCPIAVGWKKVGTLSITEPTTPDGLVPKIGRWHVTELVEHGQQSSLYKAQLSGMGVNGNSVVKFPMKLSEVECMCALRGCQGCPTLLDWGADKAGGVIGHFMALFPAEPTLEELLRKCDHDDLGGRVSWAVARDFGIQLINVLKTIHEKHFTICELKPASVCVPPGELIPTIIDFSKGGRRGSVSYEAGYGGMRSYMSIRALKSGGVRLPGDDLESLGWLLLRLVLGVFPWQRKVEGEEWSAGSNRIAEAKENFLGNPGSFGSRFAYLPPELKKFIVECQSFSGDYADLQKTLKGEETADAWEVMVQMRMSVQVKWPPVVITARQHICWRPAATPTQEGSERKEACPKGARIRTTGMMEEDEDGGMWLEVDPVWSPNLPKCLHKANWILYEDLSNGKLLEMVW